MFEKLSETVKRDLSHLTNKAKRTLTLGPTGAEALWLAEAAKMMRLYLQQFEVLRRYRNAGRQNIQVTHVYADQAIVGDVVQGGK